MRVDSFLEESARRAPDKVAIVFGERRLSYAQIDAACNRLAVAFRQSGVTRGERVAIYLENCPEAVVAAFAALKADGVFVMINATTKADKLAAILNDARPAVVVTDARRLATLNRIRSEVPSVHAVLAIGPDAGLDGTVPADPIMWDAKPAAALDRRAIDLDLAALIYTSGSTGRPKGVMLTHGNIVAASTSITSYLENDPSDVILNVLPLSFDYGLYQVLMTFQFGGTVVLERSFTYLHAILETVVRERVTGLPLVPTIAAMLLQLDLSSYDFSSLRYVTNTGAALPEAHIAELRRVWPHARLYSMYGLTECKRVSYLPPGELDRRPTSVGRGMPNQEVFLVDGEGNRVKAGIGELVIRGSHVMQGYWERPDETAEVLKTGARGERLLYSGDLFRMDDEGFLYFVGRMDDIIKTRGEKVSPREVEDVLHRLNGVAQAAVVGVPDPILGQRIKASIVRKRGAELTEPQVYRHCGEHLEDFMVPHSIEFCDALPQTANGKSDRRALMRSAQARPTHTLQAAH